VPAPEAVVGGEPLDDGARRGALRIESALVRELDELARRESGLVFDVVEVGLARGGAEL
jgi:hypothetical protein